MDRNHPNREIILPCVLIHLQCQVLEGCVVIAYEIQAKGAESGTRGNGQTENSYVLDTLTKKGVQLQLGCEILDDADVVSMLGDNVGIQLYKSAVNLEIDGIPYRKSEILGPGLGDANAGDGILYGD